MHRRNVVALAVLCGMVCVAMDTGGCQPGVPTEPSNSGLNHQPSNGPASGSNSDPANDPADDPDTHPNSDPIGSWDTDPIDSPNSEPISSGDPDPGIDPATNPDTKPTSDPDNTPTSQPDPPADNTPAPAFPDLSVMRGSLYYWGHATFTVTSADGHTLLFDPYDPDGTGYPQYNIAPDIVLISHNHWDHNDTNWLNGDPRIVHGLDGSGEVRDLDFTQGPFHIRAVAASHWTDPANEGLGNDTVFVVDVDGVRIVHMGDMGQTVMTDQQLAAIGTPDFLLIPVGGSSTINGRTAWQVVKQIKPVYAVPMHYLTPTSVPPLSDELTNAEDFLDTSGQTPLTADGNGISLQYATPAKPPAILEMDYLPKRP